jgi:hypothetical protein
MINDIGCMLTSCSLHIACRRMLFSTDCCTSQATRCILLLLASCQVILFACCMLLTSLSVLTAPRGVLLERYCLALAAFCVPMPGVLASRLVSYAVQYVNSERCTMQPVRIMPKIVCRTVPTACCKLHRCMQHAMCRNFPADE